MKMDIFLCILFLVVIGFAFGWDIVFMSILSSIFEALFDEF